MADGTGILGHQFDIRRVVGYVILEDFSSERTLALSGLTIETDTNTEELGVVTLQTTGQQLSLVGLNINSTGYLDLGQVFIPKRKIN